MMTRPHVECSCHKTAIWRLGLLFSSFGGSFLSPQKPCVLPFFFFLHTSFRCLFIESLHYYNANGALTLMLSRHVWPFIYGCMPILMIANFSFFQCQLLCVNCATPTDCSFSLRGFCRRGGITDIHAHGWGVAIYEGKRLRTFLEPRPAAKSPVAQLLVSHHPIKTYNMMAHIRYATQGAVCLQNVHPFRREMVGLWVKSDVTRCFSRAESFMILISMPVFSLYIVGHSMVLCSQWRSPKV
jgi:hypothetical protein